MINSPKKGCFFETKYNLICIYSERTFKYGGETMKIPIDDLVPAYKDCIFRTAFSITRNAADAEDIVQETFYQYIVTTRDFENEEHIKAWLLRTAINKAKNIRISFWSQKRVSLPDSMWGTSPQISDDQRLIKAVLSLPTKYRIVIHLYYYEDYSVNEISQLVRATPSAVKNRLFRARRMLKDKLKEDWHDDE